MFWGGLNGDGFDPEDCMEEDGGGGFNPPDPLFYHTPLEIFLEAPMLVRSTDKARLYRGTRDGREVELWVPFRLLRFKNTKPWVWENFSPTYLPVEDPLADFDKLD